MSTPQPPRVGLRGISLGTWFSHIKRSSHTAPLLMATNFHSLRNTLKGKSSVRRNDIEKRNFRFYLLGMMRLKLPPIT